MGEGCFVLTSPSGMGKGCFTLTSPGMAQFRLKGMLSLITGTGSRLVQ